jgi:hypothetical protein
MFRKFLKTTLASLLLTAIIHAQGIAGLNWAHTWGGSGSDVGDSVVTDASGNIYVVGSTTSFGAGGQDVLLLKYDQAGNLLWTKTWGGPSAENPTALAIGPDGGIYVTGGTDSFGAGWYDVFFLKFDPTGNLLWSKTWGGSNFDFGHDIAFDTLGNVLVAAESYSYVPSGNSAAVVLKFTPNGDLLWSRVWASGLPVVTGPVYDGGYSLDVDGNGDILLSGVTWDYNSSVLHNSIFVVKLDSAGNLLWNRNWAGPGDDEAWGTKTVRADSAGNVYVAGRMAPQPCASDDFSMCDFDLLLLKLDENGNLVWSQTWRDGTGYDTANSFIFDSNGNIAITGAKDEYGSSAAALLIRYDPSGHMLSSYTWNGAPGSNGLGIVLGLASNIIVTGSALNSVGSWQNTTGTSGTENGTLSTQASNLGWPVVALGAPSGTLTSPSGGIDTGGGGADAFTTSFTFGTVNQTGSISVVTNLAAATFTITGPQSLTGGGTSAEFSNAPAGQYTITFGDVEDYIAPAQQTQVLTSAGALSFTGSYTPLVLQLSPTILLFTYQAGKGQALPQQLTASTNGPSVSLTATATTASGGQWLSVVPASATTPATMTISVTSGLKPGTYSGTLQVAASAATNSPQEISVILAVVAGPQPASAPPNLYVNGHALNGAERDNVLFIATTVIPQLLGDRNKRISIASRSAWWALKEGVFSIPNPNGFSRCTEATKSGTFKDVNLTALETCAPHMAWQVGIAAVQVPNFSDVDLFATLQSLWPSKPVADVLEEAAQFAGYSPSNGTGAAIVGSSGYLQQSWILRHPVVGVTLVEQDVTPECVSGSKPYCYGTGWLETKEFAPNKDAALKSIADLAEIFDKYSPQ